MAKAKCETKLVLTPDEAAYLTNVVGHLWDDMAESILHALEAAGYHYDLDVTFTEIERDSLDDDHFFTLTEVEGPPGRGLEYIRKTRAKESALDEAERILKGRDDDED